MRYFFLSLLLLILHAVASPVHAQDTDACPPTTPVALVVGEPGRVVAGGAPNRVRAAPSTSAEVLFQMQGGTVFQVIGQAQCADGYRWWNIRLENSEGWTVEGSDTEYFLEPIIADTSATATPAPDADSGECALEARLIVGREGRITSGTPTRVRAAPNTGGEQVGQLQPNTVFQVLEGPVCAEGIQWWRVSVGTLEGWTAEGVDDTYLTELVELLPTPTPAYIGLPNPKDVVWNSDGTRVAVSTSDGIFLFDAENWTSPPTQIFAGSIIHSIDFAPDAPDVIAVSRNVEREGDCFEPAPEPEIFIYDLTAEEIVTPLPNLLSGCTPGHVSQLQFSADGTLLIANSGGNAIAYALESGRIGLDIEPFDFGESSKFDVIAISADASQLALAQTIDGERGYLFYADYDSGELVGFEDGRVTVPITALALSQDGSQIFIGDSVGSLRTYTRPEGADSYSDYQSFIRGERSSTSNRINAIVVNPYGEILTAESDPHAVVRVFEATSLTPISSYAAGQETSAALDLDLSPDGTLLAVLVDDTVHIVDTSDYSLVAELVLKRN